MTLHIVIGCIMAGRGVCPASPQEGSCNVTEWQAVSSPEDPLDLLHIVSPQCLPGRGLNFYINFTTAQKENPQFTWYPTSLLE